jgi:hypothetical protein
MGEVGDVQGDRWPESPESDSQVNDFPEDFGDLARKRTKSPP